MPSSPYDNIKVLIITPSLECGGAENFVSLLCNYFPPNEFRLSLAVINNSNSFYHITNPLIKVIDLRKKNVSSSLLRLKQLIIKEQPDIVFTTANHLSLFASFFKPLFSKKILWVARETSVLSINSTYAKLPAIYDLLLKKFYKNLDHIICQSSFMQSDLIRNYNINQQQTSFIENPLAPGLEFFSGLVKPYFFLTVARLTAAKGIDTILRTLSTLDVPFYYTIIGSGIEEQNLKELSQSLGLADKVHFTGELHEPFKGNEHHQLFLMASHYEGFPNAVIEAHAIGIPVVAMNAPGGISDLVIDSFNGFIAENQDDFRRKILVACTFPFNRQQISETAIARFSTGKMISSLILLFRKLYNLKTK